MKIVSKRIKELRLYNELKQIDVANYLEVDQSNYSKYELGKLEIGIDMLRKLCKLYKVSSDYIIGLTDDFSPRD